MKDDNSLFGSAPTFVSTTLPSLNISMEGIPRMANCGGVCGFSSTFSFANVNLPSYSPASSSSTGATILHGPHHSAQKSTRTGPEADNTSCWKLSSLTFTIFSLMDVLFQVNAKNLMEYTRRSTRPCICSGNMGASRQIQPVHRHRNVNLWQANCYSAGLLESSPYSELARYVIKPTLRSGALRSLEPI